MTTLTVNVDRVLDADGSRDVTSAYLEIGYACLRLDGKVETTERVTVGLEGGVGEFAADPTAADQALVVAIRGISDSVSLAVAVPATGTHELTSLPRVDVATLAPDAEPEAAWTVALEALAERVDELEDAPPPAATWNSLSGKPTAFPPTDHQHPISGVEGLPAALGAKADAETVEDLVLALDGKATTEQVEALAASVDALVAQLQARDTSTGFDATVYDDFRAEPDGTLVGRRAPSGQAWQVRCEKAGVPSDPTGYALIRDGGFSYDDTTPGVLATYLETSIPDKVASFGLEFTYEPGTTHGSNLALVAWATDPVVSWPPNAVFHVLVSPNLITVQCINLADGFLRTLDQYPYTSFVDRPNRIMLDLDGDTLRVTHPDGTRRTVVDADFAALGGSWPCWEHYANAPATDDRFTITRLFANART